MKNYQLVVTEATHLYGRLLDHVYLLKSFLLKRNKTSVVKHIYIYIYIYIYIFLYKDIYIYIYIYISDHHAGAGWTQSKRCGKRN